MIVNWYTCACIFLVDIYICYNTVCNHISFLEEVYNSIVFVLCGKSEHENTEVYPLVFNVSRRKP